VENCPPNREYEPTRARPSPNGSGHDEDKEILSSTLKVRLSAKSDGDEMSNFQIFFLTNIVEN